MSSAPFIYFISSPLSFQSKKTLFHQYVTCIEHPTEPSVCFPGVFSGRVRQYDLYIKEYSYPRWYSMESIKHKHAGQWFFTEPTFIHDIFYSSVKRLSYDI